MRDAILSMLEAAGWTRNDGPALARRFFETVNGPELALVFLTRGDEYSRTLQFSYVSEGRNIVESFGILIPLKASDEDAARMTAAAIADVERVIRASYGVRIAAMLNNPEDRGNVS